MTPNGSYIGTAAFFSFALAALIGYPSAAIFNGNVWFGMTLGISLVLTVYSGMPKAQILLKFNWLVIPVVCIAFLVICWLINPSGVQENAKKIVFLSFFTLWAPFWLPVIGFFLHVASCARVSDD